MRSHPFFFLGGWRSGGGGVRLRRWDRGVFVGGRRVRSQPAPAGGTLASAVGGARVGGWGDARVGGWVALASAGGTLAPLGGTLTSALFRINSLLDFMLCPTLLARETLE